MSQTITCNCAPLTGDRIHEGGRILYINFDPGCAICAACTCLPIAIAISEQDPWGVYGAVNTGCSFQVNSGIQLRSEDDSNLCHICHRDYIVCQCGQAFLGRDVDTECKRDRLRRRGRRILRRFHIARRDGGPMQISRALEDQKGRRV